MWVEGGAVEGRYTGRTTKNDTGRGIERQVRSAFSPRLLVPPVQRAGWRSRIRYPTPASAARLPMVASAG